MGFILLKLKISDHNSWILKMYLFKFTHLNLLAWCWQEYVPLLHSAVCSAGLIHSHLKVLAAGLKTLDIPPDFTGNQSSSHSRAFHISFVQVDMFACCFMLMLFHNSMLLFCPLKMWCCRRNPNWSSWTRCLTLRKQRKRWRIFGISKAQRGQQMPSRQDSSRLWSVYFRSINTSV